MQRFEKIKTNKEALIELLKIADPDPEMVMRYLPESDVYALYEDGEAVCVAAVAPVSEEACELKNIAAVRPGQGYGSRMMAYLFRQYKVRYSAMTVATADTSTANKAFYANTALSIRIRKKTSLRIITRSRFMKTAYAAWIWSIL